MAHTVSPQLVAACLTQRLTQRPARLGALRETNFNCEVPAPPSSLCPWPRGAQVIMKCLNPGGKKGLQGASPGQGRDTLGAGRGVVGLPEARAARDVGSPAVAACPGTA